MAIPGIRMLNPENLPKPSHHWSIAAEAKDPKRIVFTAGQGARDASGVIVGKGDCHAQVHQGFKNMKAVLTGCGMDFSNVVKFNVYLVRQEDLSAFTTAREEIYNEIYPDGDFPPTTLVIVDRLRPPDFLFEFDAIAVE